MADSYKPTQAEFDKIVIQHEMTVLLDQRPNRVLLFRKPKDMGTDYHFFITTWPGHLAISGDGGTYVFARVDDMFEFFRGGTSAQAINPQYWGEKLQAIERNGGYREYDKKRFVDAITDTFNNWDFKDPNQTVEAWKHIEEDLLDSEPESLEQAHQAAGAYTCPVTDQSFSEFWEHDLTDYTWRFIWACRAIKWAVGTYDARTPEAKPDAPTTA